TFISNHSVTGGGTPTPQGPDYIYMPPTLRQATGSGSSIWTISDTGTASQFTTSLTLINQGQIFVNGTANLTSGATTTNWTLTGASAAGNVGNQYFENDGSLNVVGTTAAALASGFTTSATF